MAPQSVPTQIPEGRGEFSPDPGQRPAKTEGDVAAPTRVSAIIPTKNRAALLREALTSVRAVEGPDLELEIIVADHGSTDDTESVARAFGARLVREPKPGAAAARNTGMRAATGQYVAFLDDDDLWLADHLRPS